MTRGHHRSSCADPLGGAWSGTSSTREGSRGGPSSSTSARSAARHPKTRRWSPTPCSGCATGRSCCRAAKTATPRRRSRWRNGKANQPEVQAAKRKRKATQRESATKRPARGHGRGRRRGQLCLWKTLRRRTRSREAALTRHPDALPRPVAVMRTSTRRTRGRTASLRRLSTVLTESNVKVHIFMYCLAQYESMN